MQNKFILLCKFRSFSIFYDTHLEIIFVSGVLFCNRYPWICCPVMDIGNILSLVHCCAPIEQGMLAGKGTGIGTRTGARWVGEGATDQRLICLYGHHDRGGVTKRTLTREAKKRKIEWSRKRLDKKNLRLAFSWWQELCKIKSLQDGPRTDLYVVWQVVT